MRSRSREAIRRQFGSQPPPTPRVTHHKSAVGRSRPRVDRRRVRRHRHQPALRLARLRCITCQGRPASPTPMCIGIVSLLLWALFITVTVKYVLFLMRADNKGEGGILVADGARADRARHGARDWFSCSASPARRCFPATRSSRRRFRCSRRSKASICVTHQFDAFHPADRPSSFWSRCFWCRAAARRSVAALFRPDHGRLLPDDRRCSARSISPMRRAFCSPSTRSTRPAFLLGARHRSALSSLARCSWRSPAPRRFTPTWAISAARRSRSPGSLFVLPALILNYLGQGALILVRPGGDRKSVLPAGAGLGAAAAGHSRRRSPPSSPARR